MSARQDRRRAALGWPGVRSASYARSTGTLVLVADGEKQGLDTEDGAMPWYTICDDHGGVCSHETLAVAREWASAPEEWCPYCQDERDAREARLADLAARSATCGDLLPGDVISWGDEHRVESVAHDVRPEWRYVTVHLAGRRRPVCLPAAHPIEIVR